MIQNCHRPQYSKYIAMKRLFELYLQEESTLWVRDLNKLWP